MHRLNDPESPRATARGGKKSKEKGSRLEVP
jgi:hypothetical protein